MARERKKTFAEIVSEVRATPPAPLDVRPGGFNAAGEFFDRAGNLLAKTAASISPADAAARVQAGASVVFESCGCGGGIGGCAATWLEPVALEKARGGAEPRFVKGFGSSTWIDLWTSDRSEVVFLHGDVEWGDFLSS